MTKQYPAGLISGNSTGGQGGAIELVAGSSTEDYYTRRSREGVDGSKVQLVAGDALSAKSTGGDVMLFAGHGTNKDRWDGGKGGSIELIAGGGHGHNAETDTGGDIAMTGGVSSKSTGGSFLIQSGPSLETSSGAIEISTSNSGKWGVSGSINISTGIAHWGDSGNITLSTGGSGDKSRGGNAIQLEVGNSRSNLGGDVTLIAGSSTGYTKDQLECKLCYLCSHVVLLSYCVYFLFCIFCAH